MGAFRLGYLGRRCGGVVVLLALVSGASRAHSQTRYVSPFGGVHEFGGLVGYSPVSGGLYGYDENVRYLPVILRYSLLIRGGPSWNLRFAPEATPIAMLYEPAPSQTNKLAPLRTLGSGVSPEGFQLVLRSSKPVQPFFSHAGGFVYFQNRVLSPQGSQFMYTIDFGTGVNLFTSQRSTATVGFRYQHLSNANISQHNPGTDACTFYIGFSHFHTSGVR